MHSNEDWIKQIDQRVANLTRTPVDFQEAVQVLRCPIPAITAHPKAFFVLPVIFSTRTLIRTRTPLNESAFSHSPYNHSIERVVCLRRYQTGQYYGAHLDYTNRLNYGKNLPKMQAMKGTYENRMATVFW